MQPPRDINNRVLIVDDNDDIIVTFKKVLSPQSGQDGLEDLIRDVLGSQQRAVTAWAFEVDSASSGEQAISAVRESLEARKPYAVVFMDVRMPPGIDGIEALERIWRIDPDIQAVICTAYSDYSWRELAERLTRISQWLILKKPFSSVEIIQCAHSLAMKWYLAHAQRKSFADFEQKMSENLSSFGKVEKSALSGGGWQDKLQSSIQDTQRSIEQMRETFRKIQEEKGKIGPGKKH